MSGVLSTATKKLAERPLAHVRFIEPLNELTAREILVRARVRRGAAGGEEQEERGAARETHPCSLGQSRRPESEPYPRLTASGPKA